MGHTHQVINARKLFTQGAAGCQRCHHSLTEGDQFFHGELGSYLGEHDKVTEKKHTSLVLDDGSRYLFFLE